MNLRKRIIKDDKLDKLLNGVFWMVLFYGCAMILYVLIFWVILT